ncbi:MAG: hypothetical protein WDN28_21770 [Chthoniobacter sp.]
MLFAFLFAGSGDFGVVGGLAVVLSGEVGRHVGLFVIDHFDGSEAADRGFRGPPIPDRNLSRGEAFLHDFLGDGSGDTAAGFRTLNHDADGILRILVRGEGNKPSVVVLDLLAIAQFTPELRRAGLASNGDALDLRFLPVPLSTTRRMPSRTDSICSSVMPTSCRLARILGSGGATSVPSSFFTSLPC